MMTLSPDGNKGNQGAERTQGKTMTYVTQVGLRPHDFITGWEQRRSGCCKDTWEDNDFIIQVGLGKNDFISRLEQRRIGCCKDRGKENDICEIGCYKDSWEDNDF